ncbi:hypothetical protein RHMOL_Rhmol07G0295300 [Rhododendron molle]|nr:hypothetical protein RHMOL_Rhmol07G0295300 [Rhododendron molle]
MKALQFICILLCFQHLAFFPIASTANQVDSLNKLITESRKFKNPPNAEPWAESGCAKVYSPANVGNQVGTMEGPGCSSLGYGAMEELGPFRVNSDGKTLYRNEYSWNNVANVIFLESPAGVGFSYSNTSSDYNTVGDKRTAADSYVFLVNWLERFPQYKIRDFYIAGESYGGHYVPQLACVILSNNKITNQTVINLKGIAIGNAYVDDTTTLQGTYDYYWTHALNSDETHAGITKYCDFVNGNLTSQCSEYLFQGDEELGDIDIYDIYAPLCNSSAPKTPSPGSVNNFDPCSDNYVRSYLNLPEVQKALHAINTTWSRCSNVIGQWADSPSTVLPTIKHLIASGIRLWVYSGDVDGRIPVTSSRYAINTFKLPVTNAWRAWYSNSDEVICDYFPFLLPDLLLPWGDGNNDGCSVFFPTCSTSSCASQPEAQRLASGESTLASTRIGSPEKMNSSEKHVAFFFPIASTANQIDNLIKLSTKSRKSENPPANVGNQLGMMEADKIDFLPGQPQGVDFDQYAGYVTVNQTAGRALFYYFVESPNNSLANPLVLWLNGGPGCSSLGYGAMEELGPFRVNSDGKTLFRNEYSWNNVANVIFLESPAGVGFSYSNTSSDYKTVGDKRTAEDSYVFLINWLERFPQYKSRDFYITGESYAGHYVPQLAYTILSNNKITNQTVINLKGIAIGNPYIDDGTTVKGIYDYYWTHALISDETHAGITRHCDFVSGNFSRTCKLYRNQAFVEHGKLDLYDIYAPLCNSSAPKTPSPGSVNNFDPCSNIYVAFYLNLPEVQKALHTRNTTWSRCSGDNDGRIPVTASRYSINTLKLAVKNAWRAWYSNSDQDVGGYVVEYEVDINLKRLVEMEEEEIADREEALKNCTEVEEGEISDGKMMLPFHWSFRFRFFSFAA